MNLISIKAERVSPTEKFLNTNLCDLSIFIFRKYSTNRIIINYYFNNNDDKRLFHLVKIKINNTSTIFCNIVDNDININILPNNTVIKYVNALYYNMNNDKMLLPITFKFTTIYNLLTNIHTL